MSFSLYVGNCPSNFIKTDVEDIFADFDGIQVSRVIKKDKKCYAFVTCVDVEQLVAAVAKKNKIIVGGREIIVRPANEELQNYVRLLLDQKKKSPPFESTATFSEESDDKELYRTDLSGGHSALELSRPNTPQNYSNYSSRTRSMKNRQVVLDSHSSDETQNTFSDKNQTAVESELGYGSSSELLRPNTHQNYSDYSPCSRLTKNRRVVDSLSSGETQNTFRVKNQTAVEYELGCGSSSAEYFKENDKPLLDKHQDDLESCVWVSVTNFPLGTNPEAITDLFSDYNPVCIYIVCNEPRYDKALTEAAVGFCNQEDADDVILNFDNTLFRGRLLFVNDLANLSFMQELLSVYEHH